MKKTLDPRMMEAAKQLLKTYKSLSVRKLTKEWEIVKHLCFNVSYNVLRRLTGFGNATSCKLCNTAMEINGDGRIDCNLCVYSYGKKRKLFGDTGYCASGKLSITLGALHYLHSPEELHAALQNRIADLQSYINKWEKQDAKEKDKKSI